MWGSVYIFIEFLDWPSIWGNGFNGKIFAGYGFVIMGVT
jgi:hypothetical protein